MGRVLAISRRLRSLATMATNLTEICYRNVQYAGVPWQVDLFSTRLRRDEGAATEDLPKRKQLAASSISRVF
jgi:hypothetical protein